MKNLLLSLSLMALSFFSISCAHYHHKHSKKEGLALITPVNNSKAHGYVRLKKLDYGEVLVTAQVAGLKPGTKHGFHIHKYGDCREQGQHAGPHLNPYGNQHGAPDDEEKHAGDLGNLIAGPKGVATYKKIVNMCLRKAGGRSIIIHAGEDDLKSQPSGNSGSYIGCGVVGYVKPAPKQPCCKAKKACCKAKKENQSACCKAKEAKASKSSEDKTAKPTKASKSSKDKPAKPTKASKNSEATKPAKPDKEKPTKASKSSEATKPAKPDKEKPTKASKSSEDKAKQEEKPNSAIDVKKEAGGKK